jgi:predicted Zn-dependent protease
MKHRGRIVRKGRALAAVCSAVLLLAIAATPSRVHAQSPSFIRDAEIEATIRDYATPLFNAAQLDPEAVDVYLIADSSLNAFVAGGMKMFLHTGLLRRADGPMQVMGVIAHEAGHIAGGDLAGRRQQVQETTPGVIASYALGLAAALATGRADAGLAVAGAGQGAAISSLLAYTRGQEGAADQAAVSYLNRAGYSPKGLLEFLEILEGQEALLSDNQDPYLRTHPLTRSRINFLQDAVQKSPHTGEPVADKLKQQHARMTAKLDGFLQQPSKTLREYQGDDSVPGRYARAIAYYRDTDLDRALSIMANLIDAHPEDPFFQELRGQMLYEHGRIEAALPAYERAVELRPDSPLLRLGLARVQVQLDEPRLNAPALDNLKQVLEAEPTNPSAWRLRAIAHGRAGDTGLTAWSLAEQRLAQGKLAEARRQAARALNLLREHSPHWLRAQDIKREAERRMERQRG